MLNKTVVFGGDTIDSGLPGFGGPLTVRTTAVAAPRVQSPVVIVARDELVVGGRLLGRPCYDVVVCASLPRSQLVAISSACLPSSNCSSAITLAGSTRSAA